MLEDDQLTPKPLAMSMCSVRQPPFGALEVLFCIPHTAEALGALDERHGSEGPRECKGLKEHEGHEGHEGHKERQRLKDHEDKRC